MADTTAAPTGGRALFVRQSSGLVREVSVSNALFFNTAAFIGIRWRGRRCSTPSPSCRRAGRVSHQLRLDGHRRRVACVFLGLIFASWPGHAPVGGRLRLHQPADPRAGPSSPGSSRSRWCSPRSRSSPSRCRSCCTTSRSAARSSASAPGRAFSSGRMVVHLGRERHRLAGNDRRAGGDRPDLLVVVQPTRRFHRIVTGLAALGLVSGVLMFIFGMIFVNRASFRRTCAPTSACRGVAAEAAGTDGLLGNGVDWHVSSCPHVGGAPVPVHRVPVQRLHRRRGAGERQARHPERVLGALASPS